MIYTIRVETRTFVPVEPATIESMIETADALGRRMGLIEDLRASE